MTRRALIFGATGQDGAYLSQLLVGEGYEVFGTARRPDAEGARAGLEWLGVADRVTLLKADLADLSGLLRVLQEVAPDEVYNLAAQSSVGASWQQPLLTAQTTAMGAANLLEAVRIARPEARLYQASSSEMFGVARGEAPLTEASPCHPRSPYGASKLFAHWLTVNYRESFGLFAASGVLFNHESPLRGPEFVSRKITQAVARIRLGRQETLPLGNIEVQRDWGHARDHVRAMWLMLQQPTADDYVIATGRVTSLREVCEIAFAHAGLRLEDHLRIDPALFRPAEVGPLRGDATKAREQLGWTPETSLEALIAEMVDADLARLS